MASAGRRGAPYLLSLPALLFFAALLVTPLLMIAGLSFQAFDLNTGRTGGLTLGNYADTLGDPYYPASARSPCKRSRPATCPCCSDW